MRRWPLWPGVVIENETVPASRRGADQLGGAGMHCCDDVRHACANDSLQKERCFATKPTV